MGNTIDIITLGCSKNFVDSQRLGTMFRARGYDVRLNPEQVGEGNRVVVNTCGFIGDAKEESINTILELCDARTAGRIRELSVMGCLSQRYLKELQHEIPEVDRWYGKFDWAALADELPRVGTGIGTAQNGEHPAHYAYVKIAEGCDRRCAYCAIPLITGPHRSRPMEEIEAEVRELVAQGVCEFQIIEQELTFYGTDLYGSSRIAELTERLAEIEGVAWLRLHYAYPDHFPMELLAVMREHENVCKYLDIALQHIANHVLERMHRHITAEETRTLLQTIRSEVPGISLRTTMMVGFPGETEADFEELLDFVREMRFERLGAFAYSEEEGTFAALHYKDDVPEDVKQHRLSELMAVQERISAELCAEKVGSTQRCIIDRKEGDYFIGRTEADSPDVDGEVLITSNAPLQIGQFYDVPITAADEFDLYGKL